MRAPVFLAWSALGAFYWTFLEYVLHRFAFHRFPRRFGRRHFQHHAKVEDPWIGVAPWHSSAPGGLLHLAAFVLLLGSAAGGALFAGFVLAYGWYEWVHYRIHHAPPLTRRGERLRAHHLAHHDGTPHHRFGVSTTFWDQVFGSMPQRASGEPKAAV